MNIVGQAASKPGGKQTLQLNQPSAAVDDFEADFAETVNAEWKLIQDARVTHVAFAKYAPVKHRAQGREGRRAKKRSSVSRASS